MNTLHIVASVCLLYSQPHSCKEITLSFVDAPSPQIACISPGPLIELSKWIEAHPQWYVKRYTCTSVKSQNI